LPFASLGACNEVAAVEVEADLPELFADSSVCPTSNRGVALHLAMISEGIADSKFLRFSFDPSNGIAAVNQLSKSWTCFRVATSEADATRIETKLIDIRQKVTANFLLHHLTLKRSIEADDLRTVGNEIKTLRSFFPTNAPEHTDVRAYVQWMETEAQRLGTFD
jgi:hypothetical protein